jgi:hypothetical protein
MLDIDRSATIVRLRSDLRAAATEARTLRARAAALLPAGHVPSRKALRLARRRPSGARSRDEVAALRAQDRALRAAAASTGPERHALHLQARDAGTRARCLGLAIAFLRGRIYSRTEAWCARVPCEGDLPVRYDLRWKVCKMLGEHPESAPGKALLAQFRAWIEGRSVLQTATADAAQASAP